MRNCDWSDAPELALVPLHAAQVDEVPFDLSSFSVNLEGETNEKEDKKKKRKELCPEAGGPSDSGDIPVMAQRQAPAGQDLEPRGGATGIVQAWLCSRGEYG